VTAATPIPVITPSRRTIAERFEDFHRENPDIYYQLTDLALEARAAGHTRYSMKALFEVLRWSRTVTTRSADPFLLNNDFTSRYARMIEHYVPELRGFFEKRTLHAE
jgi:hypothetical protein